MALINDPLQWSEGAERLNSRPHTQLYVQLKQREQAKNEAFDEYVRNLNKNINSAGLRNQERPVFEQKLADWQKFGMENRDKLRNPRQDKGGASLEFQSKYQDILNLVAESKMEEEKKKPLIEIATDPNKRERLSEDIIPDIASHDEPLYVQDQNGGLTRNPNRKSFDVSKIMFDPKPFEQDKYFKGFDDVKRSDLTPNVVKNPKDLTQTITTTSVYDQGAKDLIATRSVGELMNNPSFKKTVKGLDPTEYNDLFERNYGHPIQNEGDLAAAYTLAGLQEKLVKSEVKDDTFERQKRMEAIRFANDKALKDYAHSLNIGDEEKAGKYLDRWLDGHEELAKKGDKKIQLAGGLGWQIPLNGPLRKAFSVTVGGKTVEPDDLALSQDGKMYPVFYQYDDKGLVEKDNKNGLPVVDYQLSVPHERDDVKLAMGAKVGMKQMNQEMGGGTTKSRTVSSSTTSKPAKKEIKRSDIATRAAAAGYSTSEYEKMLKQNGIKIVD